MLEAVGLVGKGETDRFAQEPVEESRGENGIVEGLRPVVGILVVDDDKGDPVRSLRRAKNS